MVNKTPDKEKLLLAHDLLIDSVEATKNHLRALKSIKPDNKLNKWEQRRLDRQEDLLEVARWLYSIVEE